MLEPRCALPFTLVLPVSTREVSWFENKQVTFYLFIETSFYNTIYELKLLIFIRFHFYNNIKLLTNRSR